MQYRICNFDKFWNSVGIVPEIRVVVSEVESNNIGNDVINLFFFFQKKKKKKKLKKEIIELRLQLC